MPVDAQQLRPDIIVQQDELKNVTILDLGITAQNGADCLDRARARKIEKYSSIKQQYERLGYQVTLDAIIFGDNGGTDQRNHELIKFLCGKRNCDNPASTDSGCTNGLSPVSCAPTTRCGLNAAPTTSDRSMLLSTSTAT